MGSQRAAQGRPRREARHVPEPAGQPCGGDPASRREQRRERAQPLGVGKGPEQDAPDGALGAGAPMPALDTGAGALDQPVIADARRASGDAGHATEAIIHVQAKTLIELVDRARGWRDGKREVLIGLDLSSGLEWDSQRNRSRTWAEHYVGVGAMEEVEAFLSASRKKFEESERQERQQREHELAAEQQLREAAKSSDREMARLAAAALQRLGER